MVNYRLCLPNFYHTIITIWNLSKKIGQKKFPQNGKSIFSNGMRTIWQYENYSTV